METVVINSNESFKQFKKEPKEALLSKANEQGQVIVHCVHYGCCSECGRSLKCELCLNPEVQLIPNNCAEVSRLLYVENFNLPPARNFKKRYNTEFTLLFQGLPKDCTEFDFHEPDKDGNGWHVANIKRNNTDVYYVHFTNSSSWEGKIEF